MGSDCLVVFDLGGVLVRIRRGFEACARAAGLTWSNPAMSEVAEQELDLAMHRYQAGKLGLGALAREMSELIGGSMTPEQIERMHHAILVGPYQGAAEVVTGLQGRGVPVAILSNTCEEHWKSLVEYEAIACVPEKMRFLSFELGLTKPDAAIYARVEELSGYQGQAILFLDDGLAQVEGARRAGWRSTCIDYDREGMGPVIQALHEAGV